MKSVKLPQYLYTASLFLLIFLTAVCVAISAADVIIQALTDKTKDGKFDYRNLVVVGGSYVLLALGALLFSCSRMLTVRASLQDIPKLYIPIKLEDLPKKVFLKIRDEFEEAKKTRKLAEPRPEDIQAVGWAKPGTPVLEGLDFKQAIAKTPAFVEKVAKSKNPAYARPLYVPVRQYVEFLMQQGLIDKQLGAFYLDGYEIARFSKDPLSQEQYMDIMKYLAAILQNMGYNIKKASSASQKSVKGGHQTGDSSSPHAESGVTTTPSPSTSRRKSSFANNSRRRLSSHKSIRSFIESDAISMMTHESIRTCNSLNTTTNRVIPTTTKSSSSVGSSSGVPPTRSDSQGDLPTTAPITREDEEEEEEEEEEGDAYSVYDEEEVRNEIYTMLMKDKVASQHQI